MMKVFRQIRGQIKKATVFIAMLAAGAGITWVATPNPGETDDPLQAKVDQDRKGVLERYKKDIRTYNIQVENIDKDIAEVNKKIQDLQKDNTELKEEYADLKDQLQLCRMR